jgi:hypothetical protein
MGRSAARDAVGKASDAAGGAASGLVHGLHSRGVVLTPATLVTLDQCLWN